MSRSEHCAHGRGAQFLWRLLATIGILLPLLASAENVAITFDDLPLNGADLLALLQQKGLKLVTLEEAEKDPAYQADPDAPSRYGGTLLEQWMEVRMIKYPTVPAKPYKELDSVCR